MEEYLIYDIIIDIMNKFENPNFGNSSGENQLTPSGAQELNKENFNDENKEEYPEDGFEEGFDPENDEEKIEKTPEQNFVDIEEDLEVINSTLFEDLSMEERERLEQDKAVLEEQLQQETDSLVEKEKTILGQEVKKAIQEKLIEEIKQLEEEGNLKNLIQELSSDKPAEIDNEGHLKEIVNKDPKTALKIIEQYLEDPQNLLESIKFGYDIVTVLLEKWFKEEEEEKGGDSPSVSTLDQSSPEEKTEGKIDVFQEIAEQRVSNRVEEEREIRRELREKEAVLDSQTQNLSPSDGGES